MNKFVSLFCALFLIVWSFTITILASPYILGDLGGDRTLACYSLAFFGFGTAITIPLGKALLSRFGEKWVFVSTLLLFTLFNALSALAPTYFLFNAFRCLTGMAIGPFYPALNSLIADQKRIVLSWTFVTILLIAPVIGAAWGGVMAYLYNWRFPLLLNSAIGLILSVLISLSADETKQKAQGFDWIGWIFYSIGIFCLGTALTMAQELDWYRSLLFVGLLLIGVLAFLYYFMRSFLHETPLFNFKLFTNGLFSLTILSLFTLFALYFGIIVLLSIWLTLDVEFTPLWIALLLGAMALAAFLPRLIIEQRFGPTSPRLIIALATILLAISCFYTATFNPEINFGRIALSRVIAAFGLALFLPPIFQILASQATKETRLDIFELFQTVRNLGCSLGAAIFSIIWERRTVFYHERLSETINYQSLTTKKFLDQVETLQLKGDPAAYLNQALNKSASALALNDVFYLMGWISIILLLILIMSFKWCQSESKHPSGVTL